MICPHCNAENRDGAKFCDECGTRLQPAPDSNATSELSPATTEGNTLASSDEHADRASDLATGNNDSCASASEELSESLAGVSGHSEQADPFDIVDDEAPSNDSSSSFDFQPCHEPSENAGGVSTESASDKTAVLDAIPPVSEASQTRRIDLSGIDTFAPEGSYIPPSSNWRDGGTMRMPRIEEQSSINDQKSFRAPDAEKRPHKGLKIALGIFAAVCICGALAAFVTYQMELWGGKVVPDVVGLTQADATNTLESKGFSVRATQVKSDETEGIVLLMDPKQGSRANEGGEIVIHISTARQIPSIVGQQRTDAEAAMAQEGFTNVTYATQRSDEEEGSVLSVEPAEGEKARANTAITVTVAEPYIVPAIANLSQSEAASVLEEAGYTSHIEYVYTEEVAEGTVLGSDPAEGEKVASGSDIAINVALSRASELVSATQYVLAAGNTVVIDGVNYDIVSCDSVTYQGNETTSYSITATPFTYFLGVKLPLEARSVSGTITWNADNSIASGSPSISLG